MLTGVGRSGARSKSSLVIGIILVVLPWLAMPALAESLPRPDHIVVVIEENKTFADIIDNPAAPYLNDLSKRGVLFTQSYAIRHPSQPNYLALFSGSTQQVRGDECPLEFSGSNLASELADKKLSFAIYSESMPKSGFLGCDDYSYKRKHNPAANWHNMEKQNLTFDAFPNDYSELPSVSFVVPDQRNDMHNGSIAQGDNWLSRNMDLYVKWAMKHNSLLIITWDEDDGSAGNHIPTIFIGSMVKPGTSTQRINHFNILRTIEEMMELNFLGDSNNAQAIIGIWQAKISQKTK